MIHQARRSRTSALRIIACVLTVMLLACVASPSLAADQPNFVIFLADDMGYGDAGCFGHPVIKTPNLDRFASQGVRLTDCYAACSVCSPSRSSILTGRTPYRNGVWRWIPSGSQYHLRDSEISIASLLKQRGYATCHVGKWHLNGKFNSPEQPQPDDHGYDWWLATQNNAAPSHKDPVNFVRNGEPVGPMEGFSAVLVAEEAINWLRKHRDPDKPFFITVWTHEPHLPIESDPRFMSLYGDIDDEGIRQHHGNISQLDHAFGMILKTLDELDETDNTFVMFTSDNGPEGSGDKGRTRGSTGGLRGRKRSTFEGGIRVPGAVRWPGRVQPGSVSDTPVIGSDIFATVCAITDITLPADRTIDGASMLPLFQGKPIERTQPLYWRNHLADNRHKVAVRVGDWKIIGSDDLTHFELYNLREDRQEMTDLATQRPEKFDEMKKLLIEQDRQVLAEGPDWWQAEARRPQQAGPLPKGKDKTGDFDVVRGCTITQHELGYAVDAGGEGFAVRKLDKPVTGRATFKLRYRTLTDQNVRNGMLVFGDKPENDSLVKVGTGIGMGAHAVFRGTWNNIQAGATKNASFDTAGTFELTATVDLEKREVTADIGGQKITAKLPADLKQITYVGCYAKNTRTAFSAVEVAQ